MRNLSIILLSIICSCSLAQTENLNLDQAGSGQYINLVGGLPLFSIQYGFNAFGDNGDLRVRLGATPFAGFAVNTGLDALFRVGQLDNSTVYAGGGIGGIYRQEDNDDNIWTIGGTFTLGYEQSIGEATSLISESSLGYDFNTNTTQGYGWRTPAIRLGFGLQFKL